MRSIVLILAAWGPALCLGADHPLLTKTALAPKSSWEGNTLFEAVPGPSIGVDMTYQLDPSHPLKRLYAYGWATGNVAIGDLNQDGRPDLFFPGTTGSHQLFIQEEGFRFVDATAETGLGTAPASGPWGSTAIMGDIDRDGDLDLFVANFGSPNQLFINISRDGVLRFTDMAEEYGVHLSGGCLGASFVDYNNDGWLDLYIQTYHFEPEKGRPEKLEVKNVDGAARLAPEWERSYVGYFDRGKKIQWTEAGLYDVLLINDQRGAFRIAETGPATGRTYAVSHLWWDLDHDGMADLYSGNDSHQPDFFSRQTSPGKFSDVGKIAIPCSPWFPRGAVAADFNNDLQMDFFAAGYSPLTHEARLRYGEPFPLDIYRNLSSGGVRQVARNVLLANTGTSRFEEVARMAGIAHTGAAWAVKAGDYDGDGMIDLYLATGEARDWTSLPSHELIGEKLSGKTRWDLLAGQPPHPQADIAFRNLGNWSFENVSANWGLNHNGMSYGASQGDLDGDGDPDIVVSRLGEPVVIYRNHSQASRMVFDFKGTRSNPAGIGVEMLAQIGSFGLIRQLYPSGGFKSADAAEIHLGMGQQDQVRRVTFRWPGSKRTETETFTHLEAGFRYTVKEGSTVEPPVTAVKRAPLFRGTDVLEGAGFGEEPFDASEVQPGLPDALAYSGPGIALSDLNADGLAEIYISGSANRAGRFISQSKTLMDLAQPFSRAIICEETHPVFFDADGDNDLDLLIAGGGIEFRDADYALSNRLFFNNGAGLFSPAPEGCLPPAREITSAVAAADYDRDGDIDLFIGSRMKRNHYPEPGKNALLQNDGQGKFLDQVLRDASGLENSGMVTSAIWTDANNDGWIDLLIAHDWGTPQIWINHQGKLKNETIAAGLSQLSGRWNAVTGGDIDNDGDIDYLLANWGTNSGLAPSRIYTRKFEGIENPAVVFAVEENQKILPLGNWSSWAALPSVAKQARNPAEFALRASEIFGFAPDSLPLATVNELRTGLLINDGSARFQFVPLPVEAQISSAYGVVLADFNFDGRTDGFVLHNDSSPSLRHPDPVNTGVSRMFLGTGRTDLPFVTLPPDESGLVLFGNGRGVAISDFNADSRPDLVCSINGSHPVVYLNQAPLVAHQPLKVPLDFTGKRVAGVRVTVEIPGFPPQTAEYYAGGGYMSQSSAEMFFGAPTKPQGPAKLTFRWSDGTITHRTHYW